MVSHLTKGLFCDVFSLRVEEMESVRERNIFG